MTFKKTRPLFAIYFTFFLDYFGYAIVFGVFGPLLLSPEFGMFSPETSIRYRNFALATLFAAYPLMQLVSAPLFGDIADHFGRKKIFIILNIGAAGGHLLSGFAILWHHFPLLLLSRLLTGVFSSNRTVCMASLSDLSPDEEGRSNAYGTIATLGGVSWVVSMLVGSVFANSVSPSVPFWITTGLSCLSLGIIVFLFEETTTIGERFHFDPFKGFRNILVCFKIKGLGSLYTYFLMMTMGWGINLLWLNPYTLSRYLVSNQVLFMLLGSTGIAWSLGSSFLNRFLLRRYKPEKVVQIGSVGLLVTFTLCSLMNHFTPFAICALLSSTFGALAWANVLSLISLKAPENMQGKIMGISQGLGSISLLFAPLLAGVIAGINIAYVYPMAALLIAASLTTFRHKKTAATE